MKVLYAVSEARPFIASGGLADVAGSLPQALRRRLIGCRVVLPLYEGIPEEMRDELKFISHITVPLSWRRQYCGIYEGRHEGVIYYFIDNEYYFKRGGLYGHYDDAERFAFFSKAVLEILPHIKFKPDIIHCNDWQTALVPVYYTTEYAKREGYEGIKTVFTIHNIQYQGVYSRHILGDIFDLENEDGALLEYDGSLNLMKGGIECADQITTVSPTYAEEILDPWYSHGLDSILRERAWKLKGILNGISYTLYDPETDKNLWANYSAEDYSKKAVNKAELQKAMGLPVSADTPLIGLVSRLVAHKGLDLIEAVLEEILQSNTVQFVVLGSGEYQYEEFFTKMAENYPSRLAFKQGFIPSLAQQIYAGSDIFLMPSKSEPCGLAQMVSLRYGTIPIVRETGGLKDSIKDSGDGQGNGFAFALYNAHDMLDAIRRSLAVYSEKEDWDALIKRGFDCDFSWRSSANEHIKMYNQLLK